MDPKLSFRCISVVSPVGLEDPRNIEQFHQRIAATLTPLAQAWELVFVSDGRSATTSEAMGRAAADRHVRVVSLPRHLGQEAALATGLLSVRGDAVCLLDCDLENPPEALPALLHPLAEGADLALGRREQRPGLPMARRWGSRAYNALMRRRWGVGLRDWGCGMNAASGRLIAAVRPQLQGAIDRPLKAAFVRAARSWVEVPVPAEPRLYGRSGYSHRQLVRLAWIGLTRGTTLGAA